MTSHLSNITVYICRFSNFSYCFLCQRNFWSKNYNKIYDKMHERAKCSASMLLSEGMFVWQGTADMIDVNDFRPPHLLKNLIAAMTGSWRWSILTTLLAAENGW